MPSKREKLYAAAEKLCALRGRRGTPLCQDLNEKEKQAMAQRAQSAVTIDLHVAAVRL